MEWAYGFGVVFAATIFVLVPGLLLRWLFRLKAWLAALVPAGAWFVKICLKTTEEDLQFRDFVFVFCVFGLAGLASWAALRKVPPRRRRQQPTLARSS